MTLRVINFESILRDSEMMLLSKVLVALILFTASSFGAQIDNSNASIIMNKDKGACTPVGSRCDIFSLPCCGLPCTFDGDSFGYCPSPPSEKNEESCLKPGESCSIKSLPCCEAECTFEGDSYGHCPVAKK